MARIIKRNGAEVPFDVSKIKNAICKANEEVLETERLPFMEICEIAEEIEKKAEYMHRSLHVEEIQDLVENALMQRGVYNLARKYITYRYEHALMRQKNTTDDRILTLIEGNSEEANQENANKNPIINSTQRDYMAGEVSRDLTRRILLPKDVVEAHEKGIIHFHDTDYYSQRMHNCDLVNLEDMLQNGTVISGTLIEKPHSFSTACNVATQIIAQVASNQYGGQSITLSHLAPFVEISRQKFLKAVLNEMREANLNYTEEEIKKIVELRVKDEIKKGVQTLQYQVITLMTTNGQAPFITVFMYLNEVPDGQIRDDLAMVIEETINQRYQGVKNEKGVWISPAFPKLIYVLDENNAYAGSKYYYLTELAAKCSARRLVPDYVSAKIMKQHKEGCVFPPMGCRSILSVWRDENDKPKFYGRFNQGVVTINLVDVACSSHHDMGQFWKIFDERLELCHKALMCRHERLKGTVSDVAPILWQHGAIARLKPGEKIDKLLYGGYSTISLGYAGLWECVYYMTEHKLTDPEGCEFGLQVMKHMNDACNRWKQESNIGFAIYGTPMESTTYKFAQCLQRRFGIIKGVTEKNYITNSYHIHVTEPVDAFYKLGFEAQFQHLSTGGAISYVEVPNLQQNLDAVIEVMQFIYENIMYAELNTKSDYCHVCEYDGEILLVEDEHKKLVWECPQCGNRNEHAMNITRRVCGYLSSNSFNMGRRHEVKERVIHLGQDNAGYTDL